MERWGGRLAKKYYPVLSTTALRSGWRIWRRLLIAFTNLGVRRARLESHGAGKIHNQRTIAEFAFDRLWARKHSRTWPAPSLGALQSDQDTLCKRALILTVSFGLAAESDPGGSTGSAAVCGRALPSCDGGSRRWSMARVAQAGWVAAPRGWKPSGSAGAARRRRVRRA